jgi:hypothetical protein
MSLSNSTADALGSAICAALGVTDASAISKWQTICRQFYAGSNGIQLNIIVTLQPGTVVTAGGPTTQTGPAAPVVLTIA